VTIKAWGMDTIRIPVPYFIFGDREPFVGCINELATESIWELYTHVLTDDKTIDLKKLPSAKGIWAP